MRRLLVAAALLLLPLLASAEQGDALLTPDGTYFTVATAEVVSSDSTTVADAPLLLRARHLDVTSVEPVPATLNGGSHSDATMAYDADTSMLFVFWLHRTSLMGSELLLSTRDKDGVWSPATQFASSAFDVQNLRIAVTRKYLDEEKGIVTPGLTVHATWWEWDTTHGESFTQYQIVTIINGKVAEQPAVLDLRELVRNADVSSETPSVEPALLSHPMLFVSPQQDSMLVVFGDVHTQKLHQVRVSPMKPAANGRLRVPVGKQVGDAPAPTLAVAAQSHVDGVYVDNNRMAIYTRDNNTLRYSLMKNGAWSEPQTLTLDSQFSSAAAVDALRRMVADH
jgi:hypothetical protein